MTFSISQFHIRRGVDTLCQGGLIAYPTEGVWGLGCDPYNMDAVQALLELKQRPVEKGLILVASHIDQFEPYLKNLSAQQRATLQQSWPAPLTWLVPANSQVPLWISGGQASVALRVSTHPVIAALCKDFGSAIVSSSANISGKPAARTLLDVQLQFSSAKTKHVTLVPGALGDQNKPTTIRDLVSGKTIRT